VIVRGFRCEAAALGKSRDYRQKVVSNRLLVGVVADYSWGEG
jgi:hypothetical protein